MTAKIIAVVGQKGGVYKSTLARLIAVEYARIGSNVLIADMDIQQSTAFKWNNKRMQNEIPPEIHVQQFTSIDKALKLKDKYDLIVFDSAPHATRYTHQVAKEADLILLPTGLSQEDTDTQIELAHELKAANIDTKKMAMVLIGVGKSESETLEIMDYIKQTGYILFNKTIPHQTAYRKAFREGRALTETQYKSLNKKAEKLVQEIDNYLDKITKG